jgi:hypothetical protein
MFPEDMEKEYYVTPTKTIKQVKGRLHSENWGNSERMVGSLAKQFMYYTLLEDDFTIFLLSTLRDEFDDMKDEQHDN